MNDASLSPERQRRESSKRPRERRKVDTSSNDRASIYAPFTHQRGGFDHPAYVSDDDERAPLIDHGTRQKQTVSRSKDLPDVPPPENRTLMQKIDYYTLKKDYKAARERMPEKRRLEWGIEEYTMKANHLRELLDAVNKNASDSEKLIIKDKHRNEKEEMYKTCLQDYIENYHDK